MDGIKGADNFSHNQGLEWVGWKSKDGDLHLEFTFKTLRNFTGALFHSNNLFSSGVEALQAMDVHYGIDLAQSIGPLRESLDEPRKREQAASLSRFGRQAIHNHNQYEHHQRLHDNANTVWSSKVLRIEYEPDKRLESARPVTVHLDHQLANRLKFVLKFASKWILISEVEFLSHPVELMSFASLSEQHTPPLLEALKNSKSYDEYVAILREHQLRRIAANAFFGFSTTPTINGANLAHVIQSSTSTPPNNVLTFNSEMPDPQMTPDDQPSIDQQQQANNQQQADLAGSNYQSIDSSILEKQQQSSPYDNILGKSSVARDNRDSWLRDATANPASSSMFNPSAYPGIFSPALTPMLQQADLISSLSQDPIKRQSGMNQTSPASTNALGLATVIFIIVAVILLIGLLVGLSRYHLQRQQPKLGFPGFPFNSTPSPSSSGSMQGRKELAGSPIKGLVSPLMSVFSQNNNISSSHANSNNLNIGPAATTTHLNGQHPYQLDAYNTIFAPSTGSSAASNQSSSGISVRNTLGRLANFKTTSQRNQMPTSGLHQHQLLVSVKDTSSAAVGTLGVGKIPFGYQTSKDSAVSTQLIVGLNQANPLAHQQIYSNNNSSQQTYATNYSASTASSSQCGQRPMHKYAPTDYNQYATPDLNGPASGPLATRTEMLRSSCRAPNAQNMSNGNHFHNNSFTLSNRLQQQQQFNHNNDLAAEMQHNYELIHHDSDNSSSYQHQQQQAFHSRTLSKQMRYNFNQEQNLLNANADLNAKKIIDLR